MIQRDDFQKILYGVLVLFIIGILLYVGFISTLASASPAPERTPIPTLIAATLPAPQAAAGPAKCAVRAVDLFAAWIKAGYPETDPFDFTAQDGTLCTASLKLDLLPVFNEANLWYPGASACTTCHNTTLAATGAQLDLSSYSGILSGSRRASPDAKGNDILGGGIWEQSLLYEVLVTRQGQALAMPLGRPADLDITAVVVFAGTPKAP
jgi:hypothetical protein